MIGIADKDFVWQSESQNFSEIPKSLKTIMKDLQGKLGIRSNDLESSAVESEFSVIEDSKHSWTSAGGSSFQAKLQRSSSLKINSAMSGTSGSKKIVRFADAMGLDLTDVRTFFDDVPKIPSSAYKYLHFDSPSVTRIPFPSLTLVPMFQEPGHQMDFLEKVQTQSICLETVFVTKSSVLALAGIIRVMNLDYHKLIHVRYSVNNWKTYSDIQATYVPGSCDGVTDKFSFVIYGHTLKDGDKIELAIRMFCGGNQYWDNNAGINYSFNCLPETSANGFFSYGYNLNRQ